MTEIWVPLAAAFVGGVLAIAASLIAIALQNRRHEREARREARRVAVSRMLDVLDQAIRAQGLPPLARRLRNPDAPVLLALSRLLIDLPTEDLPVALWAGSQVQRMAYERNGKQYLQRATQLQSRLVSWYRGEVEIHWFNDALSEEPFDAHWRPSLFTRVKTVTRDLAKNTEVIAGYVLTYAIVKDGIMPAVSKFVHDQFGTNEK